MPMPSLFPLPLLAACAFGLGISTTAQQPPAPATQPPVPATQPAAQAPAANDQPAATPAATEGRGGRRRGGQGPGGGNGQGEDRNLGDLPEFTPVAAPPLSGLQGKQYFWFGLYPDFMAQYDPTTDVVVKKVKLAHGMFWSTTLTHDRKRILVVTDQQRTIEVLDLAQGAITSEHTFAEEGVILRIREVRELPGGVFWLVRTERVKKEVDRYSFEAAQWLLYDTAQKKTVKKVAKLPDALDRGAQLLPDGALWQSQDDDGNLLLLDGRKLTEVGRIDLRTPRFFGAGAIRLMGNDLLDRRDPGRLRMLFTSQDPIEKTRTTWGVAEIDLLQRKVVDVQEFGPQVSAWGLRIAPKKLIAAAMTGNFGGGGPGSDRDTRARLLLYDLRTGQKVADAYEEFRPRRSLVAISPDADKIYIGTAGSDFEIFDANLKRLKTVELDGEIWGRIFVVDG